MNNDTVSLYPHLQPYSYEGKNPLEISYIASSRWGTFDPIVKANYKNLMSEFYMYCFNNQYKYNHFRPADLIPDVDFDDEGYPYATEIVVFYE